MDDKNSFVIFTDIEETLNELTDEEVGRLFRGMVAYADRKEEPNFTGLLKVAFIPVRQSILRTSSKWEETKKKRAAAGRLGGLKSAEMRRLAVIDSEANQANQANQAVSVPVSVPVSVSESVPVPVSTPVDVWSLSASVLSHLNSVAGTSYKTNKADYVQLISDLSHRGYTEADMIRVIDVKTAEWLGDPKVQQYLRPSTLFGPKFEQYLSQPIPESIAKRKRTEKAKADNANRVEAFRAELTVLEEQIGAADTPTRIRLKERQAWLQDEIARLTG